ncbi:hypothetical protein K443DRAFT_672492 [Laccaria amethystina LaAM-08-1]|uniref:Uncharacterized protein n=1 Tax=Laccaria amethystina LaAM-08-1 TaxID=1095629 RepID=A0A0C9YDN9_9AGAR|nr:hypothetical protein K443DRAFT_672492 [Laccaria amethystina LaAM-08-1]
MWNQAKFGQIVSVLNAAGRRTAESIPLATHGKPSKQGYSRLVGEERSQKMPSR